MINQFLPIRTVTDDYLLTSADHGLVCNGEDITITLPEIADSGCICYRVKNAGSKTTIKDENGVVVSTLSVKDQWVFLHSDDVTWHTFIS